MLFHKSLVTFTAIALASSVTAVVISAPAVRPPDTASKTGLRMTFTTWPLTAIFRRRRACGGPSGGLSVWRFPEDQILKCYATIVIC
ncbi:hypothetical protein EI94DRAFT_758995 [Lactarius quietus]|nr:hypothetical protein EI94DRAFT_758995 [Lactarius quietus]